MVQRVRIAGSVLPRNFEDPLPSLPFFLVYSQALLVNLVPSSILPRAWTMLPVLTATSVIVAASIGIAVAQTVIVADF